MSHITGIHLVFDVQPESQGDLPHLARSYNAHGPGLVPRVGLMLRVERFADERTSRCFYLVFQDSAQIQPWGSTLSPS